MTELLATVKVEVTPLCCIYTQTRAGTQNMVALTLPVDKSRVIEVHPSNNENVYLPQKSLDNRHLMKSNSINYIQVCTKTFTADQVKVVVNAVDAESGQLVYSWLLILASQPPQPTRNEQLNARIGTPTLARLLFTNKVKRDLTYELASSRPDLMVPRQPLLSFRGNES